MTRRQRAAVVELLRCAADQERAIAVIGAQECIDPNIVHQAIQLRSRLHMSNYDNGTPGLDYYDECLEAAARVEEGAWP